MKFEPKIEEFGPIHENCQGCVKVEESEEIGRERCIAYVNPSYWWTNGRTCALVTREAVSVLDVARLAIEKNVFKKSGPSFLFNNQSVGNSAETIAALFRRNKTLLSEIKRKLGIVEGAMEEGKIRVGQQKQKRKHRR